MYFWITAAIVAIILLFAYRREKNAIWGGLTLGVIVGLTISVTLAVKGIGFNWFILGKGAIVGILLGFVAELLGTLSESLKKK